MQAPLVHAAEGEQRVLTVATNEDVNKIVARMFWLEYASLPVFYCMGYFNLNAAANVLLLMYLCVSAFVQYCVAESRFSDVRPDFWDRTTHNVYNDPLETVMGVPVGWAGRKKWQWALLSLGLNYVSVLSTAVAVGSSWASWSCLQASYAAHWSAVPQVGWFIGACGLPGVLTGLLVLNPLVHGGVYFVLSRITDEEIVMRCDAANLVFLGRMFEDSLEQFQGFSTSRAITAPFTKFPMLWCKVSLLALSWDSSRNGAKVSMLIAVGFAVYGLVPIMLPLCAFAIKHKNPIPMALALVYATYSIVVGSHLLGVWLCPSRDFSIVHGGCMAPADQMPGCHPVG